MPDGEAVITPSFTSRHYIYGYKTIEFKAAEDHTYEVSRKLVQKEAGEITATPHPSTPKGWIIHDPRDVVKLVDVTKPEAHELAGMKLGERKFAFRAQMLGSRIVDDNGASVNL